MFRKGIRKPKGIRPRPSSNQDDEEVETPPPTPIPAPKPTDQNFIGPLPRPFGYKMGRSPHKKPRFTCTSSEVVKLEKDEEEEQDEEDSLPEMCRICLQDFVDPVSTKCKHYFCEKCALKEHKKTRTCFECQLPTGGSFTPARNIIKMMAAKKNIAALLVVTKVPIRRILKLL